MLGVEMIQVVEPPWLQIALGELGVTEIPGPESDERIVEYLESVDTLPEGLQGTDQTAWCSAFVGWCIEKAGFQSTEKANARSWTNWGIPLTTPAHGCICVLWRGTPDSWQGHVAFLVACAQETVTLLGGNQRNSVSIQTYPRSRVLGFRWRIS